MSSQQSKYGAVEVAEAPAAATPKRRGVVIALCLVGGALFAVAGPAKSPRLRGALQLDQYWTQMGGVLSQVETDPTTGLEHVIATLVNGERVPVCSSGITDSYGNCVDEGCASWYDGCNTCNVGTDGALGCTRMFCEKENLGEAKCMDATEPDIVGGPTGDPKQDACCGGGSACGWTYCESQGKCTQVWECDDPPAASSTPTDPGVVNYFPTVAKQANTDCTGGESVGPCAGGTPLSTEDQFSGSGEDMGEAVPTSTATTVEGANAGTAATVKCPTECPLMLRRLQACPPPQEGYQYGEAPKDECGCTTGCPPIVKASATTTPIINTAGGTSSQSGCTGSDCIITTGSAASRGSTGAGDAKYIPGRK